VLAEALATAQLAQSDTAKCVSNTKTLDYLTCLYFVAKHICYLYFVRETQ